MNNKIGKKANNKGKAKHEIIMIAIGQCEESLTFVNGVFKKLRRAFGMRGLNPVYAGAVAILVIGLILTTINIHRLRYVVNHPFYKILLILKYVLFPLNSFHMKFYKQCMKNKTSWYFFFYLSCLFLLLSSVA